MNVSLIQSPLPMAEPTMLTATMADWERDALAVLLDHCEPDNAEQAHVLRELVQQLPVREERRDQPRRAHQ